MIRVLFTLLIILMSNNITFAFGSINPAAVNMIKYNQQRNFYSARQQRQKSYIYSEQQARYYGYRTPSNNYYQQYGNYRQNSNYSNYRY